MAHPRLGATDVCPFIPISGVSEEVYKNFKKVAERVGKKLKIPTYLYEKSATNSFRSKLPDIRKGEYEGLSKKLSDPKWARLWTFPDEQKIRGHYYWLQRF